VIVGSSTTEAWNITNKKAYAKERLKVSIKILEILKEEDVLIDGLEGIKIIAKCQETDTNQLKK